MKRREREISEPDPTGGQDAVSGSPAAHSGQSAGFQIVFGNDTSVSSAISGLGGEPRRLVSQHGQGAECHRDRTALDEMGVRALHRRPCADDVVHNGDPPIAHDLLERPGIRYRTEKSVSRLPSSKRSA